MSLQKLINKKRLVVLGLNTGTSIDSLDMAVIRTTTSDGRTRSKYLFGRERRLPNSLRQGLLLLAESKSCSLDDVVYLDNLLGQFIGRAAKDLINDLKRRHINIDLVASHGQTIRHLPEPIKKFGRRVHGTMQLGLAEAIATQCDRVVVTDFRQADIALGNEGAPITTAAMQTLCSSGKESRLIVNLGGMSNYFYFPATGTKGGARAEDCGPGNSLSDLLTQKFYNKPFDRNGAKASHGTVSMRLLSVLLGNPFFSSRARSTGREVFGQQLTDEMVVFGRRFSLSSEDLLATAVEFTAAAIARKLVPLLSQVENRPKLYLTGGGRRNIFLVGRIRAHLGDCDAKPIDALGIEGDFVEAAAYAVMGEACLRSTPMDTVFTGTTGQVVVPVLGRLTQPPVKRQNAPKRGK